LGGERNRVRARVDAVDDLDLLLAEQSLDLVDRDVDLALAVGVDRHDLVLAGDAAALVDEVDRDLRADRAGHRAAARARARQVVDDADPDGFRLGAGEAGAHADGRGRRDGALQQSSARGRHGDPPWLRVVVAFLLIGVEYLEDGTESQRRAKADSGGRDAG